MQVLTSQIATGSRGGPRLSPNWRAEYASKLQSAAQAVSCIRSRESLWVQSSSSTPEDLLRALTARAAELEDVNIVHMKTLGYADYSLPQYERSFRTTALFIGDNVRDAVRDGRADYVPVFLHEIEGLFDSGRIPLDYAFIQLSPPDEYGYMSMGVGVDCTLAALRHARCIIAEVNPNMPRAFGRTFLHVSEVDRLVAVSHPLPELHIEPASPTQIRISENVASLIPDHAVLQLGIGAVPDGVLSCLMNHKGLSLHTEMFSDGVIPLVEKGVLDGSSNHLHPGKLVAGFVLGTRKLFDFLHENPLIEFHPIQYVNDPFVIGQHRRMVAINSALQVDLTGQVCSDSIGLLPYSGFGGQVDFIRGAARAPEGKPIIALPSTAKKGTISRIQLMLDPGAGVVTSRADVHYVVTEHGIADLHGRSVRERAEALIRVADPKFRDALTESAYAAKYLRPRLVPVC